MSREDSSVATTLRELQSLEEERRREQVFLARRRQLESEQIALAEQAEAARRAQVESEHAAAEARKRMQEDREHSARAETLRAVECERVRTEHEAKTRILLSEAEFAHQRALRQDRASRLEGRVRLLYAMLVTTVTGAVLLWVGVVRPESEQLRASFLELSEGSERRINEQVSARQKLSQRLEDADEQISSLTRKLEKTEQALAEATRKPTTTGGGQVVPGVVTGSRPPATKCDCDQHDPLCACFGG
jgi:hypothetical protein